MSHLLCMATNMASIARVFSYTDCYEDFKKFARKLLAPTFVRLGWESKDTDSKDVFAKLLSFWITKNTFYSNSWTFNV